MTRWVLWIRGGPRARKGEMYWLSADETPACNTAFEYGFEIPSDTYSRADPGASQGIYGNNSVRGYNRTAILPSEVDT